MMKRSAGILPYKIVDNKLYVYLERPGGPFWQGKDKWSVVKGEYTTEKAIEAARREFLEESGFDIQDDLDYLGTFKLRNKLLVMFIVNGNIVSYNKGTLFSQTDPFVMLDSSQAMGLSEIYQYGINDVIESIKMKKEIASDDKKA